MLPSTAAIVPSSELPSSNSAHAAAEFGLISQLYFNGSLDEYYVLFDRVADRAWEVQVYRDDAFYTDYLSFPQQTAPTPLTSELLTFNQAGAQVSGGSLQVGTYETLDFSGLTMAPDPTVTQESIAANVAGNLGAAGQAQVAVDDNLGNSYKLELSFAETAANSWSLSVADVDVPATPVASP